MSNTQITIVAVLAITALISGGAYASDDGVTICNGALAPGTYQNVVVSAGAGCTIDGSTITGNFTSDHAGDSVILTNSTVRGNVTITNMSPNPDRSGILILGDAISGNVTVSDNVPEWGLIIGDCHPAGHPDICNTVGGNVTFNNNAPREGVGRVDLNVIGGNLVGTGNSFYGNVLVVDANTVGNNLTFNGNSGNLQFGGFGFHNSAGGNMVCQNNIGFATSGDNTARKVIGCN